MGMLDGQIDFVLGVDTHRDSHSAAVVNPNGGVCGELTVPTDAFGNAKVLAYAREHAPGRRVWAIEGTGSFGSGLTTYLLEHDEWVVEIDRPARARRNGAKTDAIDAVRAAREALSREHLAQPRPRGDREARARRAVERSAVIVARRSTALAMSAGERTWSVVRRSLEAEANDLESQIEELVQRMAPALLAQPGVGAITAGQILMSWSHRGRIRSEAALAALGGVAPVPASSGEIVRNRLHRGGDRQLNRGLHTIVLSRLAHHPETRAYSVRRTAEGKTTREIKRCLKRHVARQLFKLLERSEIVA